MSRQTDITVRLSAKGAEDVKRALDAMGKEGRQALRQIEQATKAARPEAKALATALDDVNGRLGGLGRDVPGVSAALGALGPMGGAAAAGLGLVAAGVTALIAQTGPMMEWAATLTDSAQALDVTTDALQFWRFALEEAGGAAEDADTGLAALNSTVGALRTGLGDTRQLEALKELKLDPDLLRGAQDTEAALQLLIRAFEGVTSEADRSRLAQRLGLEALLPVLRQTSSQVDDMRLRFTDLGAAVDSETVEALDRAQRKMEVSSQQLRASLAPATVLTADAMTWLAEQITGATARLSALVEEASRADGTLDQLTIRSTVAANVLANLVPLIAKVNPTAAAGVAVGAFIGGSDLRPSGTRGTEPRRSSPGGRGRRGTLAEQERTAEILEGRSGGNTYRAPSPPPPPPPRAGSGDSAARRAEAERLRRAREAEQAAEAERRRIAANTAAFDRAVLERLNLELQAAKTDEERRDLRRQIVEEEARQAQNAITANNQLTEATKAAQREVVAQRRLAALAEIEADEAEAALEEGRRRKAASEAQFQKAREARERADQARAREAEVMADAAMLEARTARDIAETREAQRDAELAILDLITERQLNEIELLQVSEEAKQRARAAVLRSRDAQAAQITDRYRSGADAYMAGLQREARTLNDNLNDIVADGLSSFEDALVSIGMGAEDAGEAFKRMAQGILADLMRLAARQWVILPLMQMLGLGGGSSSGASGLRLSHLNGGGGGGGVNILAQMLPNILRFNGGFGGGRAVGGPVAARTAYLVGGRGPELIMPGMAGSVIDAARTSQLLGSGGYGAAAAPRLSVHVHNAPAGTQVRQRADGGVDVLLPRLEQVEAGLSRLDRSLEERSLNAVAQAQRRGMM